MNNSNTWINISATTLDKLDSLQNLFYRVLLSVPVGCPIPIMYWDCAGLTMKHRIVQKKLLLLHHIANLDNNSLAKKIFDVQTKLSFPGLVEECQEYLVMFGAGLLTNYTKQQWKILEK